MKPFIRKASARWLGHYQRGKGAVSTLSNTLGGVAYQSGAGPLRVNGTNPCELIAAAHAASFSLTLARVLAPFERIMGFALLTNSTVRSMDRSGGSGGNLGLFTPIP